MFYLLFDDINIFQELCDKGHQILKTSGGTSASNSFIVILNLLFVQNVTIGF